MNVAIIIQARLKSERLPEKILAPLGNSTMLQQIVRRCRAAKGVDEVAVAVPDGEDQRVFEATGIFAHTGPERDLLTRLLSTARDVNADAFVRVTADCPFVCPRMIEAMIGQFVYAKKPMCVNWVGRSFPDGLDLEVYDAAWLDSIADEVLDREYFAQWLTEHRRKEIDLVINPTNQSRYRLTVDWPEDLEFAQKVYKAMNGQVWESRRILEYLSAHPELMKINAHRADGTFGAKGRK